MEAPWILKASDEAFSRRIERLQAPARQLAIYTRMHGNPGYFARTLLPHHCRLPFAGFHRLLFRWHQRMGEAIDGRTGLRHAIAAPRGCAKSTIVSLVLPLHDLLYCRERYVLLLSATERQARGRLRAIRDELDRGAISGWLRDRPIRLTAGTLHCGNIRVDAFGAGSEIRGVSHDGYRPTKIILDDAEASSSATSGRARERLDEWFITIVEHLGDVYTHIIAAGTILHGRGLLATLLARADFVGHVQRSIEEFSTEAIHWEQWRGMLLDFSNPDRRDAARSHFLKHREAMLRGSAVAWEEKEDYEILMAQLTLQGRRAFYQEKQNEPLGPEDALFDPEGILRAIVSDGALLIQTTSGTTVRVYKDISTARRFGYLDAAMGKKRKSGDFAALAVVLHLPDSTLVVERLLARRMNPSTQVQRLLDFHEMAPFDRLGIEGTGFQELLLLPIEEERRRRAARGREAGLPIEVIHPRRSKQVRIASLEPLFTAGRLAIASDLDEEFWEELANYPRARHDDALDALAGAVELATRGEGGGGLVKAVVKSTGKRRPSF